METTGGGLRNRYIGAGIRLVYPASKKTSCGSQGSHATPMQIERATMEVTRSSSNPVSVAKITAVTAVIFATDTGLDEDLVTSIVALSICVGVALLPWLPQLTWLLLG